MLDGRRPADIHMYMDLQDPALQTILRLPTEDRIQAAQAILASLNESEDAPLSPEMITLLEERLEEYRKNPEAGESWESVRASIEAGL